MGRINLLNVSCARLGAVLSVLTVICAAAAAQAQYPERAVTLIVPYGAGGGTDITARMLAKDLEAVLGKPVTVENRAGGGGWVGWARSRKPPPTVTPSVTSTYRPCMRAIWTANTIEPSRWRVSLR